MKFQPIRFLYFVSGIVIGNIISFVILTVIWRYL